MKMNFFWKKIHITLLQSDCYFAKNMKAKTYRFILVQINSVYISGAGSGR